MLSDSLEMLSVNAIAVIDDILLCLFSRQILKGHKGTINAIVVDPEGKMLFTGGGDGLICCWDIDSGECIRKMTGHESAILSLIVSTATLYKTVKYKKFSGYKILARIIGNL